VTSIDNPAHSRPDSLRRIMRFRHPHRVSPYPFAPASVTMAHKWLHFMQR
jgi:hypothetical protein